MKNLKLEIKSTFKSINPQPICDEVSIDFKSVKLSNGWEALITAEPVHPSGGLFSIEVNDAEGKHVSYSSSKSSLIEALNGLFKGV